MYKLIRPLLFTQDCESVHNRTAALSEWVGKTPLRGIAGLLYNFENKSLEQNFLGINFKNPVGLAAGFDKHAKLLEFLPSLGFGYTEIGTVTRHSQPGNPRPRLFRLVEDKALINRMGFNNRGADFLAKRLEQSYPFKIPVGINLGKSKITQLADAVGDYLYSFSKLYKYGDYFVVNISSPNTPGLRQLQDKFFLTAILSALTDYRAKQEVRKPILVKIVIDFSLEAIDEILEVCKTSQVDGIISSNTTITRDGLKTQINEAGGLSGEPIKKRSSEIIKYIHKKMPNLPIIGVGGIFTAQDAYEKIKAGASLIQVYTGFVYEGPGLAKKINKGLVELLQRDGFKNISEAVGKDV